MLDDQASTWPFGPIKGCSVPLSRQSNSVSSLLYLWQIWASKCWWNLHVLEGAYCGFSIGSWEGLLMPWNGLVVDMVIWKWMSWLLWAWMWKAFHDWFHGQSPINIECSSWEPKDHSLQLHDGQRWTLPIVCSLHGHSNGHLLNLDWSTQSSKWSVG